MGVKDSKANKKKAILAASVAGLLAVTGAMASSSTVYAGAEGDVHCVGVNACKGNGDCGGKEHSCAGKNACKGQGFVSMSQALCDKIGGKVEA